MIYFRIFGRDYVVLNSYKAAVDLLEARGGIYSDRPTAWMGKVLLGRELNVFNIKSTHPRFKKYRKQLHAGLNQRETLSYVPQMEKQARVFLRGLAESPEKFISHLRR